MAKCTCTPPSAATVCACTSLSQVGASDLEPCRAQERCCASSSGRGAPTMWSTCPLRRAKTTLQPAPEEQTAMLTGGGTTTRRWSQSSVRMLAVSSSVLSTLGCSKTSKTGQMYKLPTPKWGSLASSRQETCRTPRLGHKQGSIFHCGCHSPFAFLGAVEAWERPNWYTDRRLSSTAAAKILRKRLETYGPQSKLPATSSLSHFMLLESV